jgi:protein CpxP
MNNISRNRILLTIIGVLLITNLAVVIFFFNHKCMPTEPPHQPGFTERLKKEVGFTPDQMKIFEPKKKIFWDKMHQRFEEMKKTKENFYFQMYDPSIPDSVIIAKANLIGNEQKEIDLQVIRHFKEIRTLCSPDQFSRFDSLLPVIINRMTAPPAKK